MGRRAKQTVSGKDLARALRKQEPLDPIYYIYGDDPYQIQELLSLIVGRVQPGFKDFNLHHVTGGETGGDKIASLASQLPMMDERCVIVVREAHQLKKPDWEQLSNYLGDPSPTTCLVFLCPQPKPGVDARTKVGKALKKALVSCLKPYDNHIPRWVMDRAKTHKVKLLGHAAHRLVELLGSDLAALNNALERLSLFLGGKGDVTPELIDEVIAQNKSFNVFDLSGYVATKDLDGALRTLRGLLHSGEAPLKLLALMARAFRELMQARVALETGSTPQALAKFVPQHLPPFIREKKHRQLIEQTKRFHSRELARAVTLMHKTDLALKSTSGLTPELLMERLVLELCCG